MITTTAESFFLDPDNRKEPPLFGEYCVRCQRQFLARNKKIQVRVNWETLQVTRDDAGTELIGDDCWRAITNV